MNTGAETEFLNFSESNKIEQCFYNNLNSEVCIWMEVTISAIYEGCSMCSLLLVILKASMGFCRRYVQVQLHVLRLLQGSFATCSSVELIT